MAPSLSWCPALLIAAAEVYASDDLPATLLVLAICLVLGIALWFGTALLSEASAPSKRLASSKPLARGTPPSIRTARVSGGAPATIHRVIRLHSITTGQSPSEYNVGDHQGTRASALVRAA